MRISVIAAALAGLSFPVGAQNSPQADVAGATPIVVAPDALSATELDRIKRTLGVQDSTKINSTGSEVWQVPDSKLMEAFATAARNRRLSVDYRGEDYRTLFLPVADADLDPQTGAALQKVQQNPQHKDVQLVRLRDEEITDRILKSGFGVADSMPAEGSMLMHIKPGLDIVMQRKSLRESGDALSWSGTAAPLAAGDAPAPPPGIPDGDATLVARGNKILGSIRAGTEAYSVIPLGNGLHAVAKVDPSAFPPDHPEGATRASPAGDASMMDVPQPPPGPAEVMVGVAFTQAAAAAVPSNLNVTLDHFVEQRIVETNDGFAASGITSRVKLAGIKVFAGNEIPSYPAMVEAVVHPSDGAYDLVHDWRRSVKADAVLVMVTMEGACGWAADIFAPPARAFALVKWSCAFDNLSFQHELAHLVGARHNPEDDPDDRPFAYGHGHRVQWWRTVMSYPGGTCGWCTRKNRWSDPHQQIGGVALGTTDRSHDARLLEEMLPLLSTYVR